MRRAGGENQIRGAVQVVDAPRLLLKSDGLQLETNYDFFGGTAQPPLPLQEFFPEQPLSPVLHPPCPLQEFFPAHSCLAFFFFGFSLS